MSETIYTVSQVNNYITKLIDNEFLLKGIAVSGEVTNASISGGYVYFNIKDEQNMLSCVCFDKMSINLIKNGSQVLITGSINYYAKGGKLTFVVKSVTPYGEGLLYKKYLELKDKLNKEGLFATEHKKQIPKYVKSIGVVSSDTGAVIKDIINVRTRRNDSIDIVLYPVKVQGIGAEEQIAEGINFFSNYSGVDIVIVARGGGSFEDLMPFNTEIVARSTYNCKKPIVSAVGHETDFTIIDFVADLRAPTPSAASELCVFEKMAEIQKNISTVKKIYTLVKNNTEEKQQCFSKDIKQIMNSINSQCNLFSTILHNKVNKIYNYVSTKYELTEAKIINNSKLINGFNPQNIINRGFAKIEKDGKVLMSVKNININDNISIQLKDGKVVTNVKEIKNDI